MKKIIKFFHIFELKITIKLYYCFMFKNTVYSHLICLLLLLSFNLSAQEFQLKIDSPGDDKLNAVTQLPDGTILTLGNTNYQTGGNTNFDLVLCSFTGTGIPNWTKRIPYNGAQVPFEIQPSIDGHFFIMGKNTSSNEIIISKVDLSGNISWSKAYGVPGFSTPVPLSLVQASDGSIFIATTFNTPQVRGFLMKVNSNGDLIWAKSYTTNLGPNTHIRTVQILSDGNLLVTGYSDANTGSSCLIKMDDNGNVIWQKNYQSNYVFEIFQSTCEMNNGDIISAGYVYENNRSIMIFRSNAAGNVIWSKTYANPGYHFIIMSMVKNDAEELIVSGVRYSGSYNAANAQFFLIKLSNDGNIIWSKLLNGTNDSEMIQSEAILSRANGGGYLIAGTVLNGTQGNYANLMKTNESGEIQGCNLLNLNTQNVNINYSTAVQNQFSNINPTVNEILLQPTDITFCIENVCSQQNSFTVNLGNDTLICGNSLVLSPGTLAGHTYLWNTGETTSSIQVNTAGTYWVTVQNSCGTLASDTIEIGTSIVSGTLFEDTVLCNGDTIIINLSGSLDQVLWNDGTTNLINIITSAGTYSIFGSINGCSITDTMNITSLNSPNLSLGPDITTCLPPEGILLTPIFSDTTSTISWNNGTFPLPSVVINTSGTYWVNQQNACGNLTDTIEIIILPTPTVEITGNTNICENNETTLTYTGTADAIIWPDGSNLSEYQASSPGWIVLQAYTGTCETKDSVLINLIPRPLVNLGNDKTVCGEEEIKLSISFPSSYPFNWFWSEGMPNYPEISIQESGFYWISLEYCDEIISDTLEVKIYPTNTPLFIPNVITPNGDNINDAFTVVGLNEFISEYSIEIFNRWGMNVYSSKNIDDSWNGKYKNKDVVDGVYVYIINIKNICGKSEILNGHVTVVR